MFAIFYKQDLQAIFPTREYAENWLSDQLDLYPADVLNTEIRNWSLKQVQYNATSTQIFIRISL